MKANELMIGDWVVGNSKKTFQIGEIDPNFMYWDEVKPIPLTQEILEKNGMHLYNRKTNNLMERCNHCDCFEEDEDYRVELSLDYDGKIRWSINGDEYTIIRLDYVHQLQHALRICGIEKEIVIEK